MAWFRFITVVTQLFPILNSVPSCAFVVSEANCSTAEEAQNASVSLTWELIDGNVTYTRISHSSEVLLATAPSSSDRLLIIGGIEYESAQPVVDSPLLVYSISTNVFLKPQEQILSAVSASYQSSLTENVFTSPASRAEHASFINQDGTVFIFGGRSRGFVNDTWRGCVDPSSSNVLWDELVTNSDVETIEATPLPRIGHSFTKVFENSTTIGALVFGGLSENYIELSGSHLAFIAKASSSTVYCTDRGPKLTWRMLIVNPLTDNGTIPSARAFHTAMTTSKLFTSTKLACVIVHGGKNAVEGVIFNELWQMCPPSNPPMSVPVERMSYTWELLTEIGTTPGARYGASLTFVEEGKLALAGGSYTFPSDFLSDTWELDVNATQWIRLSFTENYTPPRRGHTLSFFSTTRQLFLVGGRDRYAAVDGIMQVAKYGAPYCVAGLNIIFCATTEKYVCISCPAGSYLESGSRKCELCPPGTLSSAGSAKCMKCPAGTFSSEVGKNNSLPCTPCPVGTFSQFLGAVSETTCSACAAGFYAVSSGSASCSKCAAGSYSDTGASMCMACPRGKYSTEGAGTCSECTAGTYGPTTGLRACFSCPRGFYSNAGAVTCSACSLNTYSSFIGASALDCQTCPSYSFTVSSGQSACKFCPLGSSWTGSTCQLCSGGNYASAATNGACLPCPKGYHTSENGSIYCQRCPVGQFTSTVAATSASDCQLCTNGSSHDGESCLACNLGTTPEPSGHCSPCAPGCYGSNELIQSYSVDSTLGCASCPTMSYSPRPGATSCSACSDNSYSMEGWRNCISCNSTQLSSAGCITGRNGLLCSGNGECAYGGCSCNARWVGGDCGVPVDDTTTTVSAAALYFLNAPIVIINASATTPASDIEIKVARYGDFNSRLQAILSWKSSNFSTSPLSLPTTLDFAPGVSQKTAYISIAQLLPINGCHFFTISLEDVAGSTTSAVSNGSDNTITVYVDDMNGVGGGVAGKAVNTTYVRQTDGTAKAVVTLDRLTETDVILSPDTIDNLAVSVRDQPINLLVAIDFSASNIPAFIELLPAIIAELQSAYRGVPNGVQLGLMNGTTQVAVTFYIDLVDFFEATKTLDISSTENKVDWEWVAAGLLASSSSWPSTDRRHLIIFAGESLISGQSVTLPSSLLHQLRSQNVFAFTLSPTQVEFKSGSDVMAIVSYGTTPAIPSTLRQAFEQKDDNLPSSVNILNDEARLVSVAQVTNFSSGSSFLPVLHITMGSFPSSTQLQTINSSTVLIGIPGGPLLSIAISQPERACFPPTQRIPTDLLPLSGWVDAWHLSSLADIQRLWKSSRDSSTLKMVLRQDTSLLRQFTSTILSVYDSTFTQISLKRTFPGSLFAVGLSLILRGYWRLASDNTTAKCHIQLTMEGSLTTFEEVSFSSQIVPFEWNYGFLQTVIPWELSSLILAMQCNTSSPGNVVEWAALGLFPDPTFVCTCPPGFYRDTTSNLNLKDRSCVRCTAGSYCTAGIKRQCPSSTFSFGEAASCETCRDGWICTDGHARVCDPGTYATPTSTCEICPSGYACQNGKKSLCPLGTFSLEKASECQSCPPGTISYSEGSSRCELCPSGWTSNYQRSRCVSCPPGETTLQSGQHPCTSCIASDFPHRNQSEVCLL